VTTTKNIETPAVDDGIGLAEALLGLAGFRVLDVIETPAEVVIEIETSADRVGCPSCGVRAEAQDRMPVDIRDLRRSGGRRGWCGANAGGVTGRRCAESGHGPRPASTSRAGPC
jgi:hypothetical protein